MIKNIIDFKNDKILFLILWFLMNKKCIVKNEKKKLRKLEIMVGKNLNLLNKI